ncbi:TIGR03960 family B12-binding radical SAM protein [uncultured Desulfosarcina sp.]|uniref:TIGR03960 family B12-binding radical SAM protein n=1 Tax=uncultured Desulfosarcina sp. TaxID=218289 RepID=UPI0029C7248A|nr:TIGR03960 family B12-binding radical SAM protein [uncultured Desulfosarcina sp.]
MSELSIQDILPLVQMPSRYLGGEVNSIRKKWDATRLHIALAFPDLYEIATSHFGIQILYSILNKQESILAERVFAPAADMEDQLRQNQKALVSLESQTPLHRFDIIGFSLLYELNYTNMVNMLDLGGIPLQAKERDESHPLVIAGGPCMCNPEPVAPFFDAIVVGDGEAVILQMTEAWMKWRTSNRPLRQDLLLAWSRIKGIYIPSFFDPAEETKSAGYLIPKIENYRKIERAVVADLDEADFPLDPIVPFGKPIHDRLRMEIARGCTRGCRFCQAGMIYRPVRERHPQKVIDSIKRSLKGTGYEDLSLLSLSTGDYSCVAPLIKKIMDFGRQDRLAVSLPSLRAGSLTPELMELIKKVRKTGFTIAPEAGSQRLRDAINKNITEADIFETVKNAFSLGWKLIKLYFMVGLPTETVEDVEAIADLVKRLQKATQQTGKRPRINVSVATFVPKPHTPFQWEPQISLEAARAKINWLKDALQLPGIQVKWQDPRVSMIEGVWARGDRQLANVLIDAWKSGCRFDGWSDFFDFDRWLAAFEKNEIRTSDFTVGPFKTEQPLAWEHIDMGVERSFLLKERKRAFEGELTGDCRSGSCRSCGVCDFDRLQPIMFPDWSFPCEEKNTKSLEEQSDNSAKYLMRFKKMGAARFLGHLEMVKLFIRSLRRARVPLKYSKGFHPMPKISFEDTLPMGMQSEEEWMTVVLDESMAPEKLMLRLAEQLPEGFEITGCMLLDKKPGAPEASRQRYLVELRDGFFNQKDLDSFFENAEVKIEKKNKKGKPVVVDLKKAVTEIELLDRFRARMSLGRDKQQLVRPARVLKTVFGLTEAQILTAVITKLKGRHV